VQANQAAIAAALADNARLMGAHLHDMQADMLAAMRSFGEQMQSLGRNGEQRVRDLDQAAASDLTQAMDRLIRRLTTQIEKADSGLVEKPAKPRRALQVVADAGGEE
jgi:phage-related minor tail protein